MENWKNIKEFHTSRENREKGKRETKEERAIKEKSNTKEKMDSLYETGFKESEKKTGCSGRRIVSCNKIMEEIMAQQGL